MSKKDIHTGDNNFKKKVEKHYHTSLKKIYFCHLTVRIKCDGS